MTLKIELKRNERVILGDCVVTNRGERTRLEILGKVPILREKDIISPEQADTPAKRMYLAIQLMYTSKDPHDHEMSYLQLVHYMLASAPGSRLFIDSINNRILTGDLYKALKETRKLIAYEKDHLEMQHAAKAYSKVAKEIVSPRELEASLLLKAAAQLQSVHDAWSERHPGLNDALLYNRRLWTVFIDAVSRDDNPLPQNVRSNITKLGAFVLGETFSLMTKPKANHLKSIIKINRDIAAGLRGRA
jgi:flagellar biosynthesis repressor protein FlbT